MDPERFDTYLSAASVQYRDDYVSIASQDDLTVSSGYSRRFVVTMPEYVQGLQFDHVLVLDVNDDATNEATSTFQKRHFLTDLYLASSRARDFLELHASKDDGGLSALLANIISGGLLTEGS